MSPQHASELPRALKDKKVAIVTDWIVDIGGAEQVLADFVTLFPKADIFTSVYLPHNPEKFTFLEGRKITTSFIQNIPFLNRRHKMALSLRPRAFESFDLSEYDLVLCSSSAESKSVITKPETLHVCYCHKPTRYFWCDTHEYQNRLEFGIFNPLARLLMPWIIPPLRMRDFIAAQRVDHFVSNSRSTGADIHKYYRRMATVMNPGVDIDTFQLQEKKGDYYVSVGRCIPYKKFDLLVETFNQNGLPLHLVTNTDNHLYQELRKKSKENIVWHFNPSRTEIAALVGGAKAFLFPPKEDFGLVPLEAMAAGTPVIAYGRWWALETVISGKTGIFFQEQTPESLNGAIEDFNRFNFNPQEIRTHAEWWDSKAFRSRLAEQLAIWMEAKEILERTGNSHVTP